jgi:hypothetical protein
MEEDTVLSFLAAPRSSRRSIAQHCTELEEVSDSVVKVVATFQHKSSIVCGLHLCIFLTSYLLAASFPPADFPRIAAEIFMYGTAAKFPAILHLHFFTRFWWKPALIYLLTFRF